MAGPWTPVQVDIAIWQGATWDPVWTLYQADGVTPWNLTGWGARLQFREDWNSAQPVVSLTDTNGITLGGPAGTISLLISAADTAALFEVPSPPSRAFRYDFELIEPGGAVRKAAAGAAIVHREVTR